MGQTVSFAVVAPLRDETWCRRTGAVSSSHPPSPSRPQLLHASSTCTSLAGTAVLIGGATAAASQLFQKHKRAADTAKARTFLARQDRAAALAQLASLRESKKRNDLQSADDYLQDEEDDPQSGQVKIPIRGKVLGPARRISPLRPQREKLEERKRCDFMCLATDVELDVFLTLWKEVQNDKEKYGDLRLVTPNVIGMMCPRDSEDEPEQFIFVFSFGCAVCWGLERNMLRQVRRLLQRSSINPFPFEDVQTDWIAYSVSSEVVQALPNSRWTDAESENEDDEYLLVQNSMAGVESPGSSPEITSDVISLHSGEGIEECFYEALAYSYTFAQSVKLASFEESVIKAIDTARPIPEALAQRGYVNMDQTEVRMQTGEIFVTKCQMMLERDILDTPDLIWENDRYNAYYEAGRRYMEIQKRVDLLDQRLAVLNDIYSFLQSQLENKHSNNLEWIIIGLIVVEIILEVRHDLPWYDNSTLAKLFSIMVAVYSGLCVWSVLVKEEMAGPRAGKVKLKSSSWFGKFTKIGRQRNWRKLKWLFDRRNRGARQQLTLITRAFFISVLLWVVAAQGWRAGSPLFCSAAAPASIRVSPPLTRHGIGAPTSPGACRHVAGRRKLQSLGSTSSRLSTFPGRREQGYALGLLVFTARSATTTQPLDVAAGTSGVTQQSWSLRMHLLRGIWRLTDARARFWLGLGAASLAAGTAVELLVIPEISAAVFDFGSTQVFARVRSLLILGVIYAVANAVRSASFLFARNRFVWTLRDRAFMNLLKKDMSFYDEVDAAEVAPRLAGDCQLAFTFLDDALNFLLRSCLTAVLAICALFRCSWKTTASVSVVVALLGLCTWWYGQINRTVAKRTQAGVARLNRIATEGLQLLPTVRAMDAEWKHEQMFKAKNKDLFELQRQRGLALALFSGVNAGLSTIVRACALAVSALLGYGMGGLRGEALNTYLAYLDTFTTTAVDVGDEWVSVMEALGSAEEVLAIADADPCEPQHGQTMERVQGCIKFNNVTFKYPNMSRSVLTNVVLHCRAGEMTALVGLSGSGKSTVANLLQRTYDVETGSIELDGVNLNDLDIHFLRQQLGVVGQDPRMFHATIAENISWGLKGVTPEHIQAAAETACAHDFIVRLPHGYDTVISDGKGLSGGQRQRLAIARAVIRDPPILILDEATSALDPISTRLVSTALKRAQWSPRLQQQRTVIVIAHRLSTVEDADQILVLDKGVVVESGTHDQLLNSGGIYTNLVEDQRLPTSHTARVG